MVSGVRFSDGSPKILPFSRQGFFVFFRRGTLFRGFSGELRKLFIYRFNDIISRDREQYPHQRADDNIAGIMHNKINARERYKYRRDYRRDPDLFVINEHGDGAFERGERMARRERPIAQLRNKQKIAELSKCVWPRPRDDVLDQKIAEQEPEQQRDPHGYSQFARFRDDNAYKSADNQKDAVLAQKRDRFHKSRHERTAEIIRH